MNYKKVDFSTWPRGDLFQFYMDHMRVVMSLTVDMDVTPLVRFVKQRGMKFYPAMIWVVSRVINVHEEFKLGWDQDGNLIRWDFVSPSYAHFHPEDGNFTKLVTPKDIDEPEGYVISGRLYDYRLYRKAKIHKLLINSKPKNGSA